MDEVVVALHEDVIGHVADGVAEALAVAGFRKATCVCIDIEVELTPEDGHFSFSVEEPQTGTLHVTVRDQVPMVVLAVDYVAFGHCLK